MTRYTVHLYREMRLRFDDIEAETPEEAAAIACNKQASEAAVIGDCEGDNLSALVDVVGDQEHARSRHIDFRARRSRGRGRT